MDDRIKGFRRAGALLALGAIALVPSACGSGSGSGGSANTLLKQTFSGSHTVNSGNLNISLAVTPAGSRTLTGPITLSFGGPFQSRGKGQLPQSNFTISFSALGRSGSIGIVSTGTSGYVVLGGTGYQLPSATFQKLESSFSQVASSQGGGGTLSKLGIDPLHWLVSPSIVGHETVGGSNTTHIRAGVNVAALLADVSTFLQRASSLGASGGTRIPNGISAATRGAIAGAVKNPSVDVWTGSSDKTIRKLAIQLTVPVSGQTSTQLGGLSSAQIGLIMQYANLNQPQTIQAPTNLRPFSEFTTKLQSFLSAVQGSAGALSGSSSAGGTAGSSGSGSNLQRYSQCVSAAGQDVAKMQRCAQFLNGK